MWVGIALSFLTIPLNAGWGPVADTFVSKFPQYLLSDLVGEYSKSILAVLVDKTSSISARRQRLGILHKRQGKHIRAALLALNYNNIVYTVINVGHWDSYGWFQISLADYQMQRTRL